MERTVIEVPWFTTVAPQYDNRAFLVYSDEPGFVVRWALEATDGAYVSIDEQFTTVTRHESLAAARRHLFSAATPEHPIGWLLVNGPMSNVHLQALTWQRREAVVNF